MSNDISFKHRHISYNSDKPDLIAVYDDTALITERAKSLIHLIQNELIGDDRTLDDSVLFEALETMRFDLMDIETLLAHFVESQKEQPQKKP